jgi:hypothetical protein
MAKVLEVDPPMSSWPSSRSVLDRVVSAAREGPDDRWQSGRAAEPGSREARADARRHRRLARRLPAAVGGDRGSSAGDPSGLGVGRLGRERAPTSSCRHRAAPGHILEDWRAGRRCRPTPVINRSAAQDGRACCCCAGSTTVRRRFQEPRAARTVLLAVGRSSRSSQAEAEARRRGRAAVSLADVPAGSPMAAPESRRHAAVRPRRRACSSPSRGRPRPVTTRNDPRGCQPVFPVPAGSLVPVHRPRRGGISLQAHSIPVRPGA